MQNLSVIVLSYNTKDVTNQCLAKLQSSVLSCQTKFKNQIEVIVLDNASVDGSLEMIKENHPWVRLIDSRENTGYSKGNNIAFKASRNPLVLFLNSDVYVKEDTLERALAFFEENNCDVLGIKLLYEDLLFQASAGNLPTPSNTILWILGLGFLGSSFHPKNEEFFSKDKKVGWVMGAFFLIKRELFESAGMFDENIFMYMDEVDLCKRIQLASHSVCFTPSIEVVHLHGASSRQFPQNTFLNELKGIKLYFSKYYSSEYFKVRLFLFIGLILRIVAFTLLGKISRVKAYLRGLRVI